MAVEHYENFPVASVLCPPALRQPVAAIYWFARIADDLADEGEAPADQRLRQLQAYRDDLARVLAGQEPSPRWQAVFGPLRQAIVAHRLPPEPLHALLDAFEQDARNPTYRNRVELLAYCSRSANPVGRLLLHLYGVSGERERRWSDAVCTALQLINFWQDLGLDQRRGRNYLPAEDLHHHGLPPPGQMPLADGAAARHLVADLCRWARQLMIDGSPLALALPGRAGWELRLVVQGGLRILDKIEALDHGTLLQRPTLGWLDWPLLLARAARMKPPESR